MGILETLAARPQPAVQIIAIARFSRSTCLRTSNSRAISPALQRVPADLARGYRPTAFL
jgi:hypothetical protein